jgi:hypothetical protein
MSAEELQRLADELIERVGSFAVSGGLGRTYVVSFNDDRRMRFFTDPSLERAVVEATAWAKRNRAVMVST